MPTNDPTRELLEAARNLAGCAHGPTTTIEIRGERRELCMACRAWRRVYLDAGVEADGADYSDWALPELVATVVDAAREADAFAANVAHAEAHAPVDPGPLDSRDRERVANFLAAASRYTRDTLLALDGARRQVDPQAFGPSDDDRAKLGPAEAIFWRVALGREMGPRFEDPSLPERLDGSPVRCPLCGTPCASRDELVTVHRCPPHLHAQDPVGLRYALDAAARRLKLATELVRELDQVDARAFVAESEVTLDEVRTTATVRMREAARAFVKASDELYAASDNRAGGEEP